MPANLTPEYLQAEKAFREAKTDDERLQCLERMLATIPKHKGTDKMQADIKHRISKLKEKIEQQKVKTKKGFSFKVIPEGAGQIALVGPPNAGKSALLAHLTNAPVEVAEYPFTTNAPIPGMMPYRDTQIQIIDLPPVCEEHTEPWVLEVIRGTDAIAIVLDTGANDVLDRLEYIFNRFDKAKVGLVGEQTQEVPWPYIPRPTLLIAHKMDLPASQANFPLLQEFIGGRFKIIPMSINAPEDEFQNLKHELFTILKIIRVYTKEPGSPPDMGQPFTIPIGSTVLDLAREIHKDFMTNLKFARIWGSSRFDGQTVQRDFVLQDGDVVEFHLVKKISE